MTEMDVRDMVRGAITATLDDDGEAFQATLQEIRRDQLIEALGVAIATTGNMVKIIAELWETTPQEAWQAIQSARRQMGLS